MALRNIYIIGPACTGKTTIINDLRKRKFTVTENNLKLSEQPKIISEVARTVIGKHDFEREEIRSSPNRCLQLQTLILNAQADAERAAIEDEQTMTAVTMYNGMQEAVLTGDRASSKLELPPTRDPAWFISDRSGIDPIVYARRYVGIEAARQMQRSPNWTELRARMAESLVILCKPVMAWLEDDKVRLMPQNGDDWLGLFHMFCAVLEESSIRFRILSDEIHDPERRVEFVLAQWRLAVSGADAEYN